MFSIFKKEKGVSLPSPKSYDLVYKKTLDYFNGDDFASGVFLSKYCLEKDDQYYEETPDDMHRRMAKEFARIENKYKRKKVKKLSPYGQLRSKLDEEMIYNLFKDFKYIIPQGSIMSQCGNPFSIGSLSNCFVVGQPYDSYAGILEKDQELAQLMKRRGGVGIDISTLRPSKSSVKNAAKTSTGAASFMERYSNTTREVAQDGRRGALMISIDVRHPDVLEFINAKKDRTKVTGANISVLLRDDFMQAVIEDEDYILRWPCNFDNTAYMDGLTRENGVGFDDDEFPKIYNRTIELTDENNNFVCYAKRVKAKEIYDAIVENAWENAEPGQMFLDKHLEYSPDSVYEKYKGITTNPCGEIFMGRYDACRLMALNLFSFVNLPFSEKAHINYELLYATAYEQQVLADDLVDLEIEHIDRILDKIDRDPEPELTKLIERNLWLRIRDVASSGRRTGCGFTALGDMLAALNVPYDSQEALQIVNEVMSIKFYAELDASIDLSIQRGSFKGFDPELENNLFYSKIKDSFRERMNRYGRRNVSWSTVAPTGSVSILTQTTSGLEPLFSPFYMRRKKINPGDVNTRVDFVDQNGDSWMEYPIFHPKFKLWMEIKGYKNIDSLSSDEINEIFTKSPWYKSTANDIDWINRVKLQGIIQQWTTHSISSTINLPNDVTKEEVEKIYLESWRRNLKGVTIYRDGSRTGVLLSADSKPTFEYKDAVKRPKIVSGESYSTSVKGENFNVVVGLLDDKPYEVFAFSSKQKLKGSGEIVKHGRGKYVFKTDKNETEIIDQLQDEEKTITRLLSAGLRHGADVKYLVEQLTKDGEITSFAKAIARTLKRYIPDGSKTTLKFEECERDDCELIFEEGCVKCKQCGNSKC